jgi:streptogramin lyase
MLATRSPSFIAAAVVAVAVIAVGAALGTGAGQRERAAPRETSFLQGRVTSGNDHREAGVWVIAETDELPTPYRKIVVTDGQGRFVIPELPTVGFRLWVRGYGLKDSVKVPVEVTGQGSQEPIELTAEVAATPQEAAKVYPANYWLSLFKPPADTASLPGGRSQHIWMSQWKLSCQLCHQMGSSSARGKMGDRAAIDAGLKKARSMNGAANGFGRDALLDAMADWGARIAGGQTPEQPPRPQGIERNFVITQWGWGDIYTYAHDEIATDKRNPTLYPNGRIWGVDLGNDRLLSVDPVTHEADALHIPTLPGHTTPWCDQPGGFATLGCPTADGSTPHLGAYQNPANPHNPMMDDQGKVWMTTQIRPERTPDDLPAFCKSDPVVANRTPHRQLGYYDTKTGHFELIDTCFSTHHLQFDKNGVLWFSNDGQVIGWFDPSKYVEGRPETAGPPAQGWSARRVDTNGDGQADTAATGSYGVAVNHVDGSVWSGSPGGGVQGTGNQRGNIQRYDPATDTHEAYHPPHPGQGPRGVDVDSKGIVWTGLGGSGHLAKFDRSKCARTWGNGDQCPEGWTLYRSPGPQIDTGPGAENVTNADFHYYLWVDEFNTLGMGKDTVILNGTGSDSLLAFNQRTEKFTVIRTPYPLNVFTRGLDGRIDDPNGGWKGRGLWFDNGTDPVLHSEIQQSFVAHVQLRPNPSAR